MPALLDALRAGQDVLVVTDAGMPSVSDPGYRLVAAAVEAGIAVTALPGPSAVTDRARGVRAAGRPVLLRGLPAAPAGERRRALAALAGEPRTLVFFEAPHRLADALADLAAAFGADRPAAVCRELTKTYEEVRRGPLGELAEWATGEVRGEITCRGGRCRRAPIAGHDPAAGRRGRARGGGRGGARKDAMRARWPAARRSPRGVGVRRRVVAANGDRPAG